ncbi:FAD dependent oxidoreductase [Paraphoma chrysanthemicola]|nr:FAD dependent oxidoreductase [Paraphoma chrysanthemicola]
MPCSTPHQPQSHKQQPHPPITTTATSRQILPVPNPVPSYWLSQPSPHANLRSTPRLPETCAIAIIGSGMAGMLTLYHILATTSAARNPLPHIVLLDARALCSGATARNGGHAKIKTDTLTGLDGGVRREFAAYVRSVIAALKELVDGEEGLAGECEFESRRSFDVFLDGGEAGGVKAVWDECLRKGEEWTRDRGFIGKEGGEEGKEGDMTAEKVTSVKGAVATWTSPCVSFWPYKLVTGLLHRLITRYPVDVLNVQTNTPVLHISTATPSGPTRLHTSRGDILADKVVFATNAWTAGILQQFEGTIVPVKGMASHHIPARFVHPHLDSTYNIHFPPTSSTPDTLPLPEQHQHQHQRHGTDYLNPRPDGSIVVGGGSYKFVDTPSSWNGNFNDAERFSKEVETHWEGYMPETFKGWEGSGSRVDSVWVGIMGRTGDGMMHVGRVPGEEGGEEERDREGDGGRKKRQQWMLAGFNGGGMALIAVAAKAVAKMVLEGNDFEEVKDEFGLLQGFGTGVKRLKGEAKEV